MIDFKLVLTICYSFIQALIEEEDDLRITYCAATICYILDDWSTVNKQKMVQFIRNCQVRISVLQFGIN